jgi:hypothetical protein
MPLNVVLRAQMMSLASNWIFVAHDGEQWSRNFGLRRRR